jgi:hypothetical protein
VRQIEAARQPLARAKKDYRKVYLQQLPARTMQESCKPPQMRNHDPIFAKISTQCGERWARCGRVWCQALLAHGLGAVIVKGSFTRLQKRAAEDLWGGRQPFCFLK